MKARARLVCDFIETQCTVEGGAPFILMPWQKSFIAKTYPDRPGAERTITRAVLSTPRKHGKTEIGAALMLTHIVGPESRPGGRVFSAAGSSKQQASLIFDRAKRMIEANPELSSRIQIKASESVMYCLQRNTRYAAVSTKSRSWHGELPYFWIYDELAQALDWKLYDALDRAQGTVPGGGLGLVISTRSDLPGNPMGDLLDEVKTAKAAGMYKHWVMQVYSASKDVDPYTMTAVRQANPGLGAIISEADVRRELEEAKATPSKRMSFRAYRLNLEAGDAQNLVDPLVWKEAAWDGFQDGRTRDDLWKELEGESCWAGLDMSETTDLTSLALWFPERGILTAVGWLPEENVATRTAQDRYPYDEAARHGDLLLTPGSVVDPEVIADFIMDCSAMFNLKELRYDRYRMAPVERRLKDRGCYTKMEPFGQGYTSMSPAIEEFERLILAGLLKHDGGGVFTMCVLNCGVKMNLTSISAERKPEKLSERGRIDCAVASLMAVADRGTRIGGYDISRFFPAEALTGLDSATV